MPLPILTGHKLMHIVCTSIHVDFHISKNLKQVIHSSSAIRYIWSIVILIECAKKPFHLFLFQNLNEKAIWWYSTKCMHCLCWIVILISILLSKTPLWAGGGGGSVILTKRFALHIWRTLEEGGEGGGTQQRKLVCFNEISSQPPQASDKELGDYPWSTKSVEAE